MVFINFSASMHNRLMVSPPVPFSRNEASPERKEINVADSLMRWLTSDLGRYAPEFISAEKFNLLPADAAVDTETSGNESSAATFIS